MNEATKQRNQNNEKRAQGRVRVVTNSTPSHRRDIKSIRHPHVHDWYGNMLLHLPSSIDLKDTPTQVGVLREKRPQLRWPASGSKSTIMHP